LNTNQKYLKFPPALGEARLLAAHPSPLPSGGEEGVRGQQNVRDKFSNLNM